MGEVQSSAAVIVRYMEEKDLQQVAELESLCFSEAWSLKLLRDSFLGQWDTLFVAELQKPFILSLLLSELFLYFWYSCSAFTHSLFIWCFGQSCQNRAGNMFLA